MTQKDNPIKGTCHLHEDDKNRPWRTHFIHRWMGDQVWVSDDGDIKHGRWVPKNQVHKFVESRA